MGLDIYGYKNCRKIDAKVFDADGEPIDQKSMEPLSYSERIYINPDFPGRADDLEDRAFYSADQDVHHAGLGYGSYNHLRDELARIAGYPKGQYEDLGRVRDSHCVACWEGKQGPFAELIHFSDCEGVIGPQTSKKLAADFAAFQDKVDGHTDPRFRNFYADLRKAFDLAAQDGFVVFS